MAPGYKSSGGGSLSASSKERVEKASPQGRPQGAASVLDFGHTNAEPDDEAPNETFDLEQILATVRETAYRWDFASDRIEWAANAEVVLGVADKEKLARGRAFALLVDAEQAGARYDGITGGPHVAANTEPPVPGLAPPDEVSLVQEAGYYKRRWRYRDTHVRAPLTAVDDVDGDVGEGAVRQGL